MNSDWKSTTKKSAIKSSWWLQHWDSKVSNVLVFSVQKTAVFSISYIMWQHIHYLDQASLPSMISLHPSLNLVANPNIENERACGVFLFRYFDYLFYIDFEASMAEPRAQTALGHLQVWYLTFFLLIKIVSVFLPKKKKKLSQFCLFHFISLTDFPCEKSLVKNIVKFLFSCFNVFSFGDSVIILKAKTEIILGKAIRFLPS